MTTHVLIVAGSDSSGGAGIARDVETVSAFGLRACLAVTAITVQTHGEVRAVEPARAELVAAQMRAALETNDVRAVKFGMLGSAATVEAVADILCAHPAMPAVLDPVLASSSGRSLLDGDARRTLVERLLPLCRLATPNLPELAMLTDSEPAEDDREAVRQAHRLLDQGARAVLVKGGHGQGAAATDILVEPGRPAVRMEARRVAAELRGTGCMLASAIAANLALGTPLEDSVRRSKAYVLDRLLAQAAAPRTA